jgi:hypothetical protein
MTRARLAGLIVLAAAGAAVGCVPEVPANPTYTSDVAAILDAHCVRCHGANDMLVSMPVAGRDHPPNVCYLQRFQNEGDCTDVNAGACLKGAGFCGTEDGGARSLIVTYVTYPVDNRLRMPPLPSESLNDWELKVLERWSSPNPAP